MFLPRLARGHESVAGYLPKGSARQSCNAEAEEHKGCRPTAATRQPFRVERVLSMRRDQNGRVLEARNHPHAAMLKLSAAATQSLPLAVKKSGRTTLEPELLSQY